jgi:hypothetical protein
MKHEFENKIKCPYCNAVYENEGYQSAEGEHYDLQCGSCDKSFDLSTYIKIEYSTTGCCKSNKELPHTLVVKDLWMKQSYNKFECTKCFKEYYDWQLAGEKLARLKEGEYIMLPETQDIQDVFV